MTAHDIGDSAAEEIAALRAEVQTLKRIVDERLRTPAFFTDEINEAMRHWLKDSNNMAALANYVRGQKR